MRYIDLSIAISQAMPVDPADSPPVITPQATVEQDGYSLHEITIGSHIGTHIDAPVHMVPGGKSLDQFPIAQFVGRGRLIDASHGFDLAAVQSADIQAGDMVLFYTGMAVQYGKSMYFTDYPAIPEDIAHYLTGQKVKLVGMDMCGPDHEPFPVHKILLGAEVLIAENLTNLKDLVNTSFTVYALPLNVSIDGAPARVIAAIED